VNSTPIGAQVFVDGEPVAGLTPLIVRRQEPGPFTLTIEKAGYQTAEQEVDPGVSRALEVSVNLASSGLTLAFPRDERVTVAGTPVTAGNNALQLSGDRLLVESRDGEVVVIPNPRLARFTDALTVAIPVFVGFGALLTVDAVTNPPTDGPIFPPSVVAIHGVTAGLIAADIALHVARVRRDREFRVATVARGDPAREQALLESADARVAEGDLRGALAEYDALIAEFPSSDLVPTALHQSAGVQILLGNENDAGVRYRRLVTELPVAGYYDTSLKNLADLAYQRGDYREALEYLADIVYLDSPFTQAEILVYAREIAEAWAETGSGAREEAGEIMPELTVP
jgi:hypothetical protein